VRNLLKVFVLVGLFVLCFNVNGFASEHKVGLSAFLGYGFTGTAEATVSAGWLSGSASTDISGLQFGAKGHYFLTFNPSFIIGLGGFFYQSKIDWDGGSNSTRKALGADIALLFAAPSMPDIHPYVRATYSFSDKLDGESGSGFGIGGGVQYDVAPKVRLFGEVMYDSASYKESFYDYLDDVQVSIKFKLSMISINGGATYLF